MSERIKSLTIYSDGSPLEKILAIYTAYLRVILETQMFYKTDEKISLCEKKYKVYFKKKEKKLDTSVSLANTFTMDDEQGIIVAMTKKSNHVEETETPQTRTEEMLSNTLRGFNDTWLPVTSCIQKQFQIPLSFKSVLQFYNEFDLKSGLTIKKNGSILNTLKKLS